MRKEKKQGSRKKDIFKEKRKQRILDIARLQDILKVTEDILQTAAHEAGVNFESLDLAPLE